MSDVVIPLRTPVTDDGRQLPMFGDPETVRELVATLHELAVTQRLQQEFINGRGGSSRPASHERQAKPGNPKWYPWRNFVLDMQRLQALTRKGDKVAKIDITDVSGNSVRVINWTMRGYGLDVKTWPPSRWNPDEKRVYVAPGRPSKATQADA